MYVSGLDTYIVKSEREKELRLARIVLKIKVMSLLSRKRKRSEAMENRIEHLRKRLETVESKRREYKRNTRNMDFPTEDRVFYAIEVERMAKRRIHLRQLLVDAMLEAVLI